MMPRGSRDPAAPLLDPENPWPGLDAFGEADQRYFFGRNDEIEELLRLIGRDELTVLFGMSGLGKTSLLQAGVFPRLRQQDVLPIPIRLDFEDSASPFLVQVRAAIAEAVAATDADAPPCGAETLWEFFHDRDTEFWSDRNRLLTPLLVFDQFEELFTIGSESAARLEDRRLLLTSLAELIEGRPPASFSARVEAQPDDASRFVSSDHRYRILIALREDYLADLEDLRLEIPSIALNRLRLTPLTGERAVEAVVSAGGPLVSQEVADRIVRFVGGRATADSLLGELSIEPALLSVVCRELNNYRRQQGHTQITTELLDRSSEGILERFYEQNLEDVGPAARAFVEDRLLTPSGYRESVAYDTALHEGLTEETLQRLVDRRLLRVEYREGRRRIELIHDRLTGVVRTARDRRRQQEERVRLEAARQAELEREREASRVAEEKRVVTEQELRRSRRALALTLSLLVAVALFAALAAFQTRAARHAEADAARSSEAARRQLASSDFLEATVRLDAGAPEEALAFLGRAIRTYAPLEAARVLAVDLLGSRHWPLRMFGPRDISTARFSPDGSRVLTISSERVGSVWDERGGTLLGGTALSAPRILDGLFSDDGTKVLTISEDATSAQVWEAASGASVGRPLVHSQTILAEAFSADGTEILTMSAPINLLVQGGGRQSRALRVWDARSGELRRSSVDLQGHSVASATFSRDGARVLTESKGYAMVWDTGTGKAIGPRLRHPGLRYAAFSDDATRVLTVSSAVALKWDLRATRIEPVAMRGGEFNVARFSRDGMRVLTTGGQYARVWNTASGALLTTLTHPRNVLVWDASFSPDGGRIATVASDHISRLWNSRTGDTLAEIRHRGRNEHQSFSADGTVLLTASRDEGARAWDARATDERGILLWHDDVVGGFVFDAGGTEVLTVSASTLRRWNLLTGEPLGDSVPFDPSYLTAQLTSDGIRLVKSLDSGVAQILDGSTGAAIGQPLTEASGIKSAVFSHSGTRILTLSRDHSARVWDARTGKPVGPPIGVKDIGSIALTKQVPITWAQLSVDGTRLVMVFDDGSARIWEVDAGATVGKPLEPAPRVLEATFSASGGHVITSSEDHGLRVWNAKDGTATGVPVTHEKALGLASVNSDGSRLVSVERNNSLARLWDLRTGQLIGRPLQHSSMVTVATFNPKGTFVLTGSEDRTARVWDARTGQAVTTPLRHDDQVLAAEFSPDGTRIVTSSSDGSARIWDLSTVTEGEGPRLADLAEAVAGHRVNDDGAVVPLSDRHERLDRLRGLVTSASPGRSGLLSFLQWYFADPWSRRVTPSSTLHVPDYIKRLLDEYGPTGREEAEKAFAGHPALR